MFRDKCYLYMGGVLPFQDAIKQCKVCPSSHRIFVLNSENVSFCSLGSVTFL